MAEVALDKRGRRRWTGTGRWLAARVNLAHVLRAAAEAAPGFLLACADVMGMPPGLHVAYITASAAMDRDVRWPVAGAGVAFLLRLICGYAPQWGLLGTLLMLLLSRMVVFGRGNRVLMGYAAVCMLPCVFAGWAGPTASGALLALASSLVAALAAPLMYRALKALPGSAAIQAVEDRTAVGFMMAAMVCGGARMMLLGINAGAMLATAVLILMGMSLGAGVACTAGMIAGLAMALQQMPLMLSVALALGGFLAGIAHTMERRWITCIACALGAWLAMLLSGTAGLGCGAGVLCGAAAVGVIPTNTLEQLQRLLRRFLPVSSAPGDAYAASALRTWEKTVQAMAMAVPSPLDLEEARTGRWWEERLCSGCPELLQCGCMQSEYAAGRAEQVWQCRRSADEVWQGALEELRGLGCRRLFHLRASMDAMRRDGEVQDRLVRTAMEQRSMLVTHLTAMAGAARRFAMLSAGESWWEDRNARRIRQAISEGALPVRLIYVCQVTGHVQAAFELQRITGARRQAQELCRMTEELLGVMMDVTRVDEDRVWLSEKPPLEIACSMASACIAGSEICGDTVWSGLLQDGRSLTVLSDGMGHGRQAALSSRQTTELLRLCLDAGYTRHQALTAVNGMMLLAGSGERYATADMLLVDLWTGEATLDKLGGCSSWLIRDGELTPLSSEALPVGIVEEMESRGCQLHLRPGDAMLLVTDGVEDALGSQEALRQAILEAIQEQDADRVPQRLLDKAALQEQGLRRDDQSAVLVCVQRYSTLHDQAEGI